MEGSRFSACIGAPSMETTRAFDSEVLCGTTSAPGSPKDRVPSSFIHYATDRPARPLGGGGENRTFSCRALPEHSWFSTVQDLLPSICCSPTYTAACGTPSPRGWASGSGRHCFSGLLDPPSLPCTDAYHKAPHEALDVQGLPDRRAGHELSR